MMTWWLLTHFWHAHDILFTHFGSYPAWVHWNKQHFWWVPGIREWQRWPALWGWVNIHG
jgi:hypothetical protein